MAYKKIEINVPEETNKKEIIEFLKQFFIKKELAKQQESFKSLNDTAWLNVDDFASQNQA